MAETLAQVVRLDEALTALMIPPGQCAHKLPPLANDEQVNATLSDPEHMFMRWWQTVQHLRIALMHAFERIILEDLDFCNSAHVEQGMWKSVFYTLLESLRTWLVNPYMTG